MQQKNIFLLVVFILLIVISCSLSLPHTDNSPLNPAETFTAGDEPVAFNVQSFSLSTPWGYNRQANAQRKYPLVVIGSWGEGVAVSQQVGQKYPAFYLQFSNHSEEDDGVLLSGLIDEALGSGYRIDLNRVYLTGFSMGGSGSFDLVRGMLSEGKFFAAIIRVAGQSESVLADAAVSKTSLWYHIGLNDDASRVSVARETYANLKNHADNAGAVETVVTDTLTGYERVTSTLHKNKLEIVKYSEYTGMGHDSGPCYTDPALFDWLFNQSLVLR